MYPISVINYNIMLVAFPFGGVDRAAVPTAEHYSCYVQLHA